MSDAIKSSIQIENILENLGKANAKLRQQYPGPSFEKQPIHTVYGGAHLFKSNTALKLSETALKHFLTYAPNVESLMDGLCLDPRKEKQVTLAYERTIQKLKNQGVEDLRIDFEDGFGLRSNEEEDRFAKQASQELYLGHQNQILSPMIGIRIKSLSEETKARAFQTLWIFLESYASCFNGQRPILPSGFVITLPKVEIPEQVKALVDLLALIEKEYNYPTMPIEIMIETTYAIINHEGKSNLRALYEAAQGRCRGIHFGTYDYSASANISASQQSMTHQACEFAKQMILMQFANVPVFLADGVTNIMPVPVHKGESLTQGEIFENHLQVYEAWRVSFQNISHSLRTGFYQGWDVHPGQISIRYLTQYLFFLDDLPKSQKRLSLFIQKATQASRLGEVFDDAATAQGLLNYFMNAYHCGAILLEDVLATGLTVDEIQTKSFDQIMKKRK
jgi:citrate lyase beta subunit